jgi:hypothetical protein
MQPTLTAIATLVEDTDLYPRATIDSSHISDLAQTILAGIPLPPIVIDAASNAIIDGIHRARATRKIYGATAEILAERRTYKNRQDMYLDACRLNGSHGRPIKGVERVHALCKGIEQDVPFPALASAFGITVERVEQIVAIKTGHIKTRRVGEIKTRIPLKGCLRHLWNKDPALTSKQIEAMGRAPGQPQWLLIRQLCDLIEQKLLDWEDERVVKQIERLKELLLN